MGLMTHLKRWRYVYGWRLRYWWMDTKSGEQAQVALRYVTGLIMVVDAITMGASSLKPRPAHAPQESFFWFIILLVIMIAAAAAALALRPKAQAPATPTAKAPNTDDGQPVKHHFGECWVDDSFILAWKVVGTDKIKSKGGKK